MTSSNSARPIITLTTDFGLDDSYVAEVKGVILGINPHAVIIDVSHAVRPQRLLQAVFLTQCAWPAFPTGATHIVVVDPGVGTERRGLALTTPRGFVVGPDNGVLSSALPEEARPPEGAGPASVPLPAGYRASTITNHRLIREPVSATFHARDVFAPAAAHLSLGLSPEELGEPAGTMIAFSPLRAQRRRDGVLEGHVLHIDRFGNVVTDARAEDLPESAYVVELAGTRVSALRRAYAEGDELAALIGSGGYLEIALPNGSAADFLNADVGTPFLVRPER